ncbi:MAG: hypothetical protein WAV41_03020 [Microgenomates group bacterium]
MDQQIFMNNISPKQIITDFSNKRKNPVLFLDIKEVGKNVALLVSELLKGKFFDSLDVVLQTPGGNIDAAFLIAKLIRKSTKNLTIFVPLYAKSAGTLICLSADHLLLTDISELGPLDTQIFEQQDGGQSQYVSALNGFKALEQVQLHSIETLDITTKLLLSKSSMKICEAVELASDFCGKTSGKLYQKLNPAKIGEYARALEIGESYGVTILNKYCKWDRQKAEMTVKILVKQYPSHEYVIDLEELTDLGIPAELICDELVDSVKILRNLMLQSAETQVELIEPTTNQNTTLPNTTPPVSISGNINIDDNERLAR